MAKRSRYLERMVEEWQEESRDWAKEYREKIEERKFRERRALKNLRSSWRRNRAIRALIFLPAFLVTGYGVILARGILDVLIHLLPFLSVLALAVLELCAFLEVGKIDLDGGGHEFSFKSELIEQEKTDFFKVVAPVCFPSVLICLVGWFLGG